MTFNTYQKNLLFLLGLVVMISSCFNDLDTEPLDEDEVTSAVVFDDPAAYKQVLAKVYAGLSVSGQQGPTGQADIAGIDEGFGQYTRGYWYHQELCTDEAVIGWNDATIKDFHEQDWSSNDGFISAFYSRIFYQIVLCNEFLRETTDSKLSGRGVDATLKAEIQTFRAEVRFLRALSYWHALDLFQNVPFVTEEDKVGAFFPPQTSGPELYQYIESELKAIETLLIAPGQNEYARADQAAAWMLLAKLYLNAEVYAGKAAYTECITYCQKIIDAGYTLEPEYDHLFLADNHTAQGIIFPVTYDGVNSRTWGGTTFLVHAAIGGSMNASDFGVDGGWGGIRTTSAFVNKFPESGDKRAMFYTEGQTLEIADISQFTEGYAITKWKNVDRDGFAGSDLTHTDTDFPMFRLADAYLMYAEAVLRGGSGGDMATAVNLVNSIRERAYGDASGNITANELTLDFILDERARELYWEGHRRTDLIRFSSFSESTYLWPWKGGVAEGASVSNIYDLYPIPASDLNANPNLEQNTGY